MEEEERETSIDVRGRCPELAADGAKASRETTSTSTAVCSSTSPTTGTTTPAAASTRATSTPASSIATAATESSVGTEATEATEATATSPATTAVATTSDGVYVNSTASGREGLEEHVAVARKGSTEAVGVQVVPSLASPARNQDLRKALVGFYSVHNPGRITNLDAILTQYEGKEGLLIERLEHKYSADLSYARRSLAVTPVPAVSAPVAGTSHTVPGVHRSLPSIQQWQQQVPQQQTWPLPSTSAAAVGAPPGLSQSLSPPMHSNRPVSTLTGAALAAQRGGGIGGGDLALPRPLGRATAAGLNAGKISSDSGAPTQDFSGVGVGGPTTANYMTYLADQIRSNVEGFLPASSGGGIAGGGSPPYPVSFIPSAAAAGAKNQLAAGFEGAAWAERRGAGAGTLAATGDGRGSSLNASRHYHRSQGELDHALTARVRTLEEERGGLLAACRRMQAKAEAASREAAAAEELREAGQRKMSVFAERAAAAEKQAREATARLRALERGQAALKAEKEASARRLSVKHAQLLSAVDLQMCLRSQLEGLLEVVPPQPPEPLFESSSKTHELGLLPRKSSSASATVANDVAADSNGSSPRLRRPPDAASEEVVPAGLALAGRRVEDGEVPGIGCRASAREKQSSLRTMDGGCESGTGGDEGGGGRIDEIKKHCSVLEVCLRASRTEALEARRSRDAAESTVRHQNEALAKLKGRVSELEASLEREQEAGKRASRAASGLETELELRLDHLRKAEADFSDQTLANSRLKEELRGALARLSTASAARAALIGFCRQERAAVELLAAEQVVRAEESAGMRGEEGLATGLELARMAEELGEKRAAGLKLEVDRLGKALFSCRAELASSETRVQGLRRELERAAETIVGLSKSAIAPFSAAPATAAAAAEERRGSFGGGAGKAGGFQEGPGGAAAAGAGGIGRKPRNTWPDGSVGLAVERELLMGTPFDAALPEAASDSWGGTGGVVATGVGRGDFVDGRSSGTAGLSITGAAATNPASGSLNRPGFPSVIVAAPDVSAAVETSRRAIRGRSPRTAEQQQQTGFDMEL